MENKIDCSKDISVAQAVQVMESCTENVRSQLDLSVLDMCTVIELLYGRMNKSRADMYAAALMEMHMNQGTVKQEVDNNAVMD